MSEFAERADSVNTLQRTSFILMGLQSLISAKKIKLFDALDQQLNRTFDLIDQKCLFNCELNTIDAIQNCNFLFYYIFLNNKWLN